MQTTIRGSVPECVTVELLQSFVNLFTSSYPTIVGSYKYHGEKYNVRWDFAVFEMLVKTNHLSLDSKSFNFGNIAKERFVSFQEGIKAHIQMLVMYTGRNIPIYERALGVYWDERDEREVIEPFREYEVQKYIGFSRRIRWSQIEQYKEILQTAARYELYTQTIIKHEKTPGEEKPRGSMEKSRQALITLVIFALTLPSIYFFT